MAIYEAAVLGSWCSRPSSGIETSFGESVSVEIENSTAAFHQVVNKLKNLK